MLATYLQTDFDKQSKALLENFKIEFAKRGHLNCTYGRMSVILYNIKTDDVVATLGYNMFHFGTIAKYISRVMMSNCEQIAAVVLICIHVLYGGMFNTVLIGILVFTTFVEESIGRSFWWRILYTVYLFVTLFKRIYVMNTYLANNKDQVAFIFGPIDSMTDIVCIVITMLMIGLLKKFGVDNKSAIDFENPGMSIVRLVIN